MALDLRHLPPLNALRAFEVAGRHLNFRAAADELGVTQGAVAQQIRGLEDRMGFALFRRLPRGLALTEKGAAYLVDVRRAFEILVDATETARATPLALTISVTPSFAAKWLIPRLPAFTAALPGLDLRIFATEALADLEAGDVDLAVRQTRAQAAPGLIATRLFAQDLVMVASPHLIGDTALPIPPDSLTHFQLLHDPHDHWLRLLGRDCLRRVKTAIRFNQTTLAIDAAIAGQGITIASRFLVAAELAAGRLVEVGRPELDDPRDYYVVIPRKSRHADAVRQVADWLLDQA